MVENMAVINEVPDVRPAKIHADLDARERMRGISVPVGNLDHIQELTLNGLYGLAPVDLEIVLRQNVKMNLMEVDS